MQAVITGRAASMLAEFVVQHPVVAAAISTAASGRADVELDGSAEYVTVVHPGRLSSPVRASGGLAVVIDLDCAGSQPFCRELHLRLGLPCDGPLANFIEDKRIVNAVSWAFTDAVLPAERNAANPRAVTRRGWARERESDRRGPALLLEMT